MFVIETFEAGCQPHHLPTAPLVAKRIDTIKRCATAPKDRAEQRYGDLYLMRQPRLPAGPRRGSAQISQA
jgi:hypothetical protein